MRAVRLAGRVQCPVGGYVERMCVDVSVCVCVCVCLEVDTSPAHLAPHQISLPRHFYVTASTQPHTKPVRAHAPQAAVTKWVVAVLVLNR
jgi:hypothetical protein